MEFYKEERMIVSLVGRLDDSLILQKDKIGFIVEKGDRSCYLHLGNMEESNDAIETDDDDLLIVFLRCLLSSGDEKAIEFSDIVRGLEEGIEVDGVPVSVFLLEKALGKVGEAE